MGKTKENGDFRGAETEDTPEPAKIGRSSKADNFEITISGAGLVELLQTSAAVAAKAMHYLGMQLDDPRVLGDPDAIMRIAAQATGYQLDLLKNTATLVTSMKDKSGKITAFTESVMRSVDEGVVASMSSPGSSRLGRLVAPQKN